MEALIIVIALSFISRLINSNSKHRKSSRNPAAKGLSFKKAMDKKLAETRQFIEEEDKNSQFFKGDDLKAEIEKERNKASENEPEFAGETNREKEEILDSDDDYYSRKIPKSRDIFEEEYSRKSTDFKRGRLKQAIILSEIIGKPVSKR